MYFLLGLAKSTAFYAAAWVLISVFAYGMNPSALIGPVAVWAGIFVIHFGIVMISRRFRGWPLEAGEAFFDFFAMDVTNPFRGLVALGGPKHLKDGGFWVRAEAMLHFVWAIALLGLLLVTLVVPLLR